MPSQAPKKSRSAQPSISTLQPDSLARGRGETGLRWPLQQGEDSTFPWDQLARRWYEREALEFFCFREICFHGKEQGQPLRAGSHDPLFGVRLRWPVSARKGELYRFQFKGEAPALAPGEGMTVNDLEIPDLILINGRVAWERGFGESLEATVDYVPTRDGPMTITLVKDQFRTWRDFQRGYGGRQAIVHAVCRGYVHLHLGLRYHCEHLGPSRRKPTQGRVYTLPRDLRWFKNPGVWRWVPDETVPAYDYPPLVAPSYPTDNVLWNQFHDLYLDLPEFGGTGLLTGNAAALQGLISLSMDNGIRCFIAMEPVLQALEALGLQNDPSVSLWFSGCYIKRSRTERHDTAAKQHDRRMAESKRLVDVLRRFPLAQVVYRINEFSGCQYHHVTTLPEDRARAWPKRWFAFAKEADQINREALDDLLAAARRLAPKRLLVAANVQSGHLAAHPLHCGADLTVEKTIGRQCVNLVIANSRGVNRAFDRPIGLQHDAWGGLNYNRDSASEIEAIHRSFFFNGGMIHDAEFGAVGVDRDGRPSLTARGIAWFHITRFAALHPRRGDPRVRIGFLRGSDNVWGWYYPVCHTLGQRSLDGFDPAEPKEYVDFDLLNTAFPAFGKWNSFNPKRPLTGTPYGPCDLVPWDAPVSGLTRYHVLVMLGANRMEPTCWNRYVKFVEQGGTLVMGLCHVQAPDDRRVYSKRDLSDLFGIKLGPDRLHNTVDTLGTLAEVQTFVNHHYNQVALCGAEVVERLPNGDPLVTRFRRGKGCAYFFTTDRLTTQPGVADALLRQLFAPEAPLELTPTNDRIEIAISQKGDLRLVTLMDHGRDRFPTDAGLDSGPWNGTICFHLDRLGLPAGDLEIYEVRSDAKLTRLTLRAVPMRRQGTTLMVRVRDLGHYREYVLGPAGRTREAFFHG